MDYEATDREMSQWLVVALKNGTRFFLTDGGNATDMLVRARRFRYFDWAHDAAKRASAEYAWRGFDWQPLMRAEVE
jgi:hypothetical protein